MKTFTQYISEVQTAASGSELAKRGFEFERQLISAYTSKIRPMGFSNICNDMDDLVYKKYKKKIKRIEINSNLKRTSGGGLPKADISFLYTFEDDTQGIYSFSLKTTSAKRVSVHQGTVQQFLDGLNLPPDNEDFKIIKQGMEQFNLDGSWKTIKTWEQDKLNTFKQRLDKALMNIAAYVMSIGNGGTSADAVILYNPILKKYTVATDSEYIALCQNVLTNIKGLGGIFSYTYPHKQKGKQIQLKIPVILTKSM